MSQEIQHLVDQLLAKNLGAPPKDLKLHLTALLEARSTYAKRKVVVKRREKKVERKEINY